MNTIKKGWKDMELDKQLINLRIDVIERNLVELQEITAEGYSHFKASYRNELAAKQALMESIEACIDISNHIIATYGFRRPMDYKDIFLILGEQNILNKTLSLKLQEMAKFRNVLVHRYIDIENERLFTLMENESDDFKDFIKQILVYTTK
jgi:uncharacterized protein YutE (UPF0331/DUF86 family)